MEACAGAYHRGSELSSRGFDVKLIALQFVKPYVRRNKTIRNDAEAIYETVSSPSMRFLPLKTLEQQDIQAIHRVRSEVIKSRNAGANQIRGEVAEYRVVAPAQIVQLRNTIPRWLVDAENGLTH